MTRIAVFLAVLALYANKAHAQLVPPIGNVDWCSIATVTRCQDPGFYQSFCGRLRCPALLRGEYDRQFDASPAPYALMTTPMTLGLSSNQLALGKPLPYDYSTHHASGGFATYGSTLERAKVSMLLGSLSIDPRFQWKTNGARSRSCEEWVWERYRTLHDWEDAALDLGADYLSIYRSAYAAGGPAVTPIRDSLGGGVFGTSGTATMLSFPATSPKNGFFEPLDLRMPAGAGTSTLTAYWKPRVDAGSQYYAWTWSLQKQVGDWALASYTADHLEELYNLQKGHRELLKARRERYDVYERDYTKCRATGSVAACQPYADAATSELSALDLGIAYSLWLGSTRGCLDTSGWRSCDWSPRMFFDLVQTRIGVLREPDVARCKRFTGNQFGPGSLVAVITASGLSNEGFTYLPAADYAATPSGLAGMLVGIERYVASFDWPKDSSTGKPTLSAWGMDSARHGNEWFGVEYGYTAGWGVSNMSVICETQAKVGGEAWAKANVIKTPITLFDAKAWVSAKYDPQAPTTLDLETEEKLYIAGQELLTAKKTPGSGAINLVIDVSQPKRVNALTTYIVIMGVPVKLQGGAAGVMGIETGLAGTLTRNCSAGSVAFEVGGKVKPYVGVSGFAQASIDALIAEAGVRGELTLLRVDLPLTASVKTGLDTQGTLSFSAGTKLGLQLKSLDGRIGIFARLGWKSTERTLIEWTGPTVDTTLFEYNFQPVSVSLVQAHLSDTL